jgi:hypothetical protein
MLGPEQLLRNVDSQNIAACLGTLPIVFLLTKQQIEAILIRDQNQCQFPFKHKPHKKLTVHHINGINGNKKDVPRNLITVCKKAHWNHIHNGDNIDYRRILKKIASANTKKAKENGWTFPK